MYSSQAAVSCSVCLRTHRAYLSLPRAQAFANPYMKKKTVVRGLLPGKGLRMGLLRTRLDNVASSAMESISRV